MTDCQHVDVLATPYVDGEIGQADRELVDRHLRACGPCRSRIKRLTRVCDAYGSAMAAIPPMVQ